MKRNKLTIPHNESHEDPVEEALRRSAASVNPDPAFVDGLAVRLERAREQQRARRRAREDRRTPWLPPRRTRWFALAGAAMAVLLIVLGLSQLGRRMLPASPALETASPVATEPASQESAEHATPPPAHPTTVPTPVETEPPFAADLPPAVVTALPRPGEEVNLRAGVLLRFTQPMDRDSVESAVRVSSTEDREPVTGAFTWQDDQTVTFGPKALASGVRYRVAVEESARSINGLPLNRDLVFDFTTVGPLTVTHTSPAGGAEALRGDAPLVLTFNYPIVPLNCTGQLADAEAGCPPLPLEVEPTADGEGMWINTGTYRFDPAPAWAAGETYTVTVPAGLQSVDGATLEQPVTSSFATAAPYVQRVSPAHGTDKVPLETGIRIVFNTPMDAAATEAAFSLTGPEGAPVSGQATWESEGATLVFTPTARLATETTYTVTVDAAARTLSGSPLGETETASFATTPPLRVVAIRRIDDGPANRIGYYETARVVLKGLLDATTLNDHVTVTRDGEPVENRHVSSWYDTGETAHSIYVNWDKEPGERTCVRVLPGLADRYGNTIDAAQQACFIVDDMPPTFTPIIRQEPFTLDASEAARIYFASVGLSEVTLTLSQLTERDLLSYEWVSPGQVLREWDVALEGAANETVVAAMDLAEGQPLPTGYYGLEWDYEREQNARYGWSRSLRFAVVDRHVLLKMSADEALVWVTDLRSGAPVPDAGVRLLSEGGTELGRGVTDTDGVARFTIPEQDERWFVFTALTGEPGQPGFGIARSNWHEDVGPWSFDIPYAYEPPPAYRAYLQTDRPIYRPGQALAFRGIVRTDPAGPGADGAYEVPEPGTEVRVELRGPDFTTEQDLLLPVSEMGTLEGSFQLPDDARLGTYNLAITLVDAQQVDASVQVAVAAYRKPEFEVGVTPQQVDWLDGDTLQALVEARYYAGGNVSNARVRWSVRAEPFTFDPDVSGWWQWGETAWGWHPWREGEVVAEGEGTTDAEGRLRVTLPGNLAPLGDQETVGPQRWVLEATVTDETAFAVTQQGEMTVHTGRFYLGLRPRAWVALAGEEAPVDLLALDWAETPVSDQPVTIKLARRTWTYTPTPRPFEPGTWTHEDRVVETTTVTTDAAGEAVALVTPPDSGSYVVLAESTDRDGNTITGETTLWVSGPQAAAWRLGEGQIEPVADAERYRPGDVAQILLPTPFEAPYEVLMTIEREGILEVRRFTGTEANPLIEVPITDAHVPNIVVSFVVVKGVGAGQSTPDVRVGMVALEVDPVDRLLNVLVTAVCAADAQQADGSCTYAPGDEMTLTVRAADAQGNPVDAEVALAVVDKAVLALVDDTTPTLRDAFYAPRPLGVVTGDNLLVLHNRLAEDLEALRIRAQQTVREAAVGGIGGGGGGEAAYLPDVRREFPDTALWEARLRTGPTGETQVSLRLPDSLTTWVADARAVTADTLVGQATTEFVVTRPLLVRPVTPRFLVAGDRTEVAAVVHNNTIQDLDVQVRLQTNLEIATSGDGRLRIPAQGRVRVAWTVTVPATGLDAATLIFTAEGGGYRDAARPSVGRESDHALPIYRYESPEVVSTSGALTGPGSRVEVVVVPPEAGPDSTLTLRLAPTLAAGMTEGLSYLETYPHASTEQLVSRFLPNVVTARALQDLGVADRELEDKLRALVPETLDELYTRQNPNGGWGWWREKESDVQVTAYATLGLVQARRAGFDVDGRRIDRATAYLARMLAEQVGAHAGTLPQALTLYVLTEADQAWPAGADAALFEARENLDVTGRAYLALALGLRDPEDARVTTLLESLRADAEITASGAHWESVASEHWVTWTRATSLVVDALARLVPDDPLLPQAVRWLMLTRTHDRWETTQETAWAVIALTDYMVVTGELSAAYDWGTALNMEALNSDSVTPENRQDVVEQVIPLSDMLRTWPNALEISRGEGPGTLYYTADLALSMPVDALEAESRGLTVERQYCRVDAIDLSAQNQTSNLTALPPCEPVTSARPGDLIEVRLSLVLPRERHYLVIEDAYPAGMEPVDPTLNTEQAGTEPSLDVQHFTWWGPRFDHRELRDERAVFYADRLAAGTYLVRYYLRAAVPGTYQVIPTMASEMYFPEVWGRSEGSVFVVAP